MDNIPTMQYDSEQKMPVLKNLVHRDVISIESEDDDEEESSAHLRVAPKRNPILDKKFPDLGNNAHVKISLDDAPFHSDHPNFSESVDSLLKVNDLEDTRDELIRFANESSKSLCDECFDGFFEKFCSSMTELLETPPSGYEIIAMDAVDLLVETGCSILPSCTLPGRIAINTVCEKRIHTTDKVTTDKLNLFKDNLRRALRNRHHYDNEDLQSIIRDDSDLQLEIALQATTLIEDLFRKEANYFEKPTSETLKGYSVIFKKYILVLLRLHANSGDFAFDDNGKACGNETVNYFQLRLGNIITDHAGNVKKPITYTPTMEDALRISMLCVQMMQLEETDDQFTHSIAGIFCRACALQWTVSDLEAEDISKSSVLSEESPRSMHRAISALNYISKLCVLLIDDVNTDANIMVHLAHYAHSIHTKDLSNLARVEMK